MSETGTEAIAPSDALESANYANGLFGQMEHTPSSATESTNEDEAPALDLEASKWHWSDGVEGKGERPEWLKSKYKTVEEQATAYNELEKKLGAGEGAPKEGYSFEGINGLDPQAPMLGSLGETFKELGINQKQAAGVVSKYMELASADLAAEMKALGPQAQEQMKEMHQWLTTTFKDPDTVSTALSWIHTAEDFKVLQTLRAFQPRSASPTAQSMNNTTVFESVKTVRNEKSNNWEKYQSDQNYRAKLDERLANAVRRNEVK